MSEDVKEMLEEQEEEKEQLKKGNLVSEDEIPKHEIDELPPAPTPTKEELGRFQSVAECRCCHAPIYVEEYRASKVTRPALIYTCDPDTCWASFEPRDVLWEPSFFGVTDINFGDKNDSVRDKNSVS
ncbi:MAG: hypothetical protein ACXABY_09760 [Candidatus Thorarchaeota archaeon]